MTDTPQNPFYAVIQYKEWWKKYFTNHVLPLCFKANFSRLNTVLIFPNSDFVQINLELLPSSQNPPAISSIPPYSISSSQLFSKVSKRKSTKKDTVEGNEGKEVTKKSSKNKGIILSVNAHYL